MLGKTCEFVVVVVVVVDVDLSEGPFLSFSRLLGQRLNKNIQKYIGPGPCLFPLVALRVRAG